MSCSIAVRVFDPMEENFPFRVRCTDLTDFKEQARQRAGLRKDLEPDSWILIRTPMTSWRTLAHSGAFPQRGVGFTKDDLRTTFNTGPAVSALPKPSHVIVTTLLLMLASTAVFRGWVKLHWAQFARGSEKYKLLLHVLTLNTRH